MTIWLQRMGWRVRDCRPWLPSERGRNPHDVFENIKQKPPVGDGAKAEGKGFHGCPGGSDDKASACKEGDPGSILGQEDPLEKEMATHPGTLAWKIPWTEEPGRLQSMGSQRIGHD